MLARPWAGTHGCQSFTPPPAAPHPPSEPLGLGGEEPEEAKGPVGVLTAPWVSSRPRCASRATTAPPAPAINTTARAPLRFFKYFIFVTTSELKIFHK